MVLIVPEQRTLLTIDNPSAAKGNIGDYVEVTGKVGAKTKTLHIDSVKLITKGRAMCDLPAAQTKDFLCAGFLQAGFLRRTAIPFSCAQTEHAIAESSAPRGAENDDGAREAQQAAEDRVAVDENSRESHAQAQNDAKHAIRAAQIANDCHVA
ncbi:MAG: hypothetical protein ACRD4H_06115 [Candidatus Acidiferrales bacterium]